MKYLQDISSIEQLTLLIIYSNCI